MGGIVGGITDAVGLTNNKGEKQAANAAAEANAAAAVMSAEQIALAKDQLAFNKEQYVDWKNIYGDVQTNLAKYFNGLSPNKIIALGLENQQKEFQQVEKSIKRDFAQRGLTDSGAEASVSATNKVQNAVARATIRSTGEQTAAERKLQFLGVGLGQGTQLLGQVNNAASNVTNAFSSAVNSRTNVVNSYLGRANTLGVQNLQATNDILGTFTGNAAGGR